MSRRLAAFLAVTLSVAMSAFVIVLAVATGSPTARAAASAPNGDAVANLFEWNWNSVASECTNYLGPAGFGGVQVAPPEESVSLPASAVSSATAHPWWEVYQPVSYNLTSRLGTRAQFAAMVTACHNAGVKVIVDTVINHMAGDNNTVTSDYGGSTWSPTGYTYDTPGYTYSSFHHYGDDCPESDDQIANWDSVTDVQECELLHLSDLYTQKDAVRATIAGYMNDLISLGADGFRVDAAKHIAQADFADILSRLNTTTWQGTAPYVAQEVYPGSSNTNLQYAAFEGNGSILNFTYAYDLYSAFNGGSLSGLNSLSLEPSAKSLSFVTNHDTERSGTTLTYKSGSPYALATYFTLAYGYGVPEVYDGFDWSTSDQSPPSDSSGYVTDTTCGSGWECVHRTTGVTGMVGWHNAVGSASVANWTAGSSNVIAFSRGAKGWIGLNNSGSAYSATYATGLPDGTYCDVIAGGATTTGCAGTSVTVSSGSATVTVPANSALAIDVNALSGGGTATATPTATSTVSVTFNEYASTSYGTNVYVTGSVAGLGGWSTSTSSAKALSSAGYPIWSTTLPANSTISFKYIKVDSSGNVTWESNANRSIATGTSAATVNDSWNVADADATDVTFNETATTTTGTNVYVVGSIAALGGWSTTDAIPLSSASYPVWKKMVIVPKSTTFTYKYLEKDSSGNVTWESGSNRSYTSGTSTSDTWK